MAKILFYLVMAAFLGVSVWWAVWVWTSMDAELSTDGSIALTLGIVVSLVVGIGLMALLFASARRGYDETVEFELPGEDKAS